MFRFKIKYLLTNKQTRLILLLTVCVSLSIIMIGLFSYSKYRQALDTELNKPNVELLQINLDVTNRAFRESDGKAVEASFHSVTLAYLNASANERVARAAELQAYLQTLVTQPDIQSLDVVKFADRTVLSSQYGYRSGWEEAPDTTWIPWIGELEKKPLLVKRRLLGTNMISGQTELLSLARPIMQNGQVTGAVIVNLDYDRLFSKMYIHLSNYQYVYNLEGDLIYPKLNLPISLAEMSRVIASLKDRPYAYVKADGQDYMANQTFSDVTGWRLISLVPTEQLLKNVKLARNMMLLLSLISIAVGCSAMYYSNYAAFRPLKRINKLLNPGQQPARQADLHDLEPIIGKLVGEFQSKSIVAERGISELQSKYIQDVLSRNIGSQEIRTKWEQYFHDWEKSPFAVIVVSIDRYGQWAAEYAEEDQMLLKYALHNIVLESLEPLWRTVSIAARKDGLAVLVQAKVQEAEPWTQLLRRDAGKMVQMIRHYLKISVSAGIGSEVSDIQHVSESYAQAEEALSYRIYAGYGGVRDYTSLERNTNEGMLPPGDAWITEIADGVQSSDGERSSLLVRKWVEDVRTNRSEPQAVYTTVNELLEYLLNIAAVRNLAIPSELADYTRHQVTTMELTELAELLIRIVSELAAGFGQYKQTKEYVLVQDIIEFMKNHLQDNIGLQEIADHVHMGISSVSMIFKEETGNTVYDYLTGLRITKACQLLEESQLKIADIAVQVGYQNENSFIRAFRKLKAITPGKYRESSKSSDRYADPPKPRGSGISDDSKED